MKSADEIIQDKEWFQLTDAEKAIVHDIAGNEKEYNLLKKILQVSAAETVEVPNLNAGLKTTIDIAVGSQKKHSYRYGWLAAACVLLIVVSVFILNNQDKPHSVVKDIPAVEKPIIKKDSLIRKDNNNLMVQKPEEKEPAKKSSPAASPGITVLIPEPHVDRTSFANVTVAAEAELLDLITEAE